MRFKKWRAALIGFVLVSTSSVLAPAAPVTIYNLGTLGGSNSYGFAVNTSGQVAGYSYTSANVIDAFRYDGTPGSSGAMRDLGVLPGGTTSNATGINATGQVSGLSTVASGLTHAFRYDGTPGAGGIMRDLGTLGGLSSAGNAINSSGQVVGYSQNTDRSATLAFRYDGTPGSGGIMRSLGTLGGPQSYAYAINDAAQVAGYSYISGNNATTHAFRYDGTPGSGGVMRDLGTLSGDLDSTANGINASGQVTGSSNSASNVYRAFRYDGTTGAGGVMRDLGSLGGTSAAGAAIDSAGDVVGYSTLAGDAVVRAFAYLGTPGAGGHMVNLDTWLDLNDPTDGANWTLESANGLTDSGLITGFGTYSDGPGGLSDGERAFLLDASSLLPEPGGLMVLGVMLVISLNRCGQRRVSIVAVLGVCFSLTGAVRAAPVTIYNLGTLGGNSSFGLGLNSTGGVTGDSYLSGNTVYHAIRYDGIPGSGGIMRDLGTLGGNTSEGTGINASGQVAGVSDITGNGNSHAFRYDGTPGSGGVMRDLGTLGGVGSSGAQGINSSGQVVGVSDLPGNISHAFRYDGTPGSGGVMRDLGTLGSAGQNSVAMSVNASGQVVGSSNTLVSGTHAFRYDGTPGSGGVMRDLGTLGGINSNSFAINDSGQVTGSSQTSGNSIPHAFRYDGTPGVGGVMHDLGVLGGAFPYSEGHAINGAGVVVGASTGTTAVATLWKADLSIVNLDSWLDAVDPADGADWTLTSANGITDTGLITGYGTYNDGPGGLSDGQRAFLLDASSLIPEPNTAGILVFIVSLATRRISRARARNIRVGECAKEKMQ